MTIKHETNRDDWQEEDEFSIRKLHGRSIDYEKKRRRAERIIEQKRIRDLIGLDIDYPEED